MSPLAPCSPLSDPKANARPAHRASPRLPALALTLSGAPLRPLEACRRRPQETHWSWTQRPGHPYPASRCPTGAHAHPGILGQDSPTGQPDGTPKPLAARRQGLRRPPGRSRAVNAGVRFPRPEDGRVRGPGPSPPGHPRGSGAAGGTHGSLGRAAWSRTTDAKAASRLPQAPSLDSSHGSQGQAWAAPRGAFSGTAVTRPTHRAGALLSRSSVHNLRPAPDRRPLKGTLTTRLS